MSLQKAKKQLLNFVGALRQAPPPEELFSGIMRSLRGPLLEIPEQQTLVSNLVWLLQTHMSVIKPEVEYYLEMAKPGRPVQRCVAVAAALVPPREAPAASLKLLVEILLNNGLINVFLRELQEAQDLHKPSYYFQESPLFRPELIDAFSAVKPKMFIQLPQTQAQLDYLQLEKEESTLGNRFGNLVQLLAVQTRPGSADFSAAMLETLGEIERMQDVPTASQTTHPFVLPWGPAKVDLCSENKIRALLEVNPQETPFGLVAQHVQALRLLAADHRLLRVFLALHCGFFVSRPKLSFEHLNQHWAANIALIQERSGAVLADSHSWVFDTGRDVQNYVRRLQEADFQSFLMFMQNSLHKLRQQPGLPRFYPLFLCFLTVLQVEELEAALDQTDIQYLKGQATDALGYSWLLMAHCLMEKKTSKISIQGPASPLLTRVLQRMEAAFDIKRIEYPTLQARMVQGAILLALEMALEAAPEFQSVDRAQAWDLKHFVEAELQPLLITPQTWLGRPASSKANRVVHQKAVRLTQQLSQGLPVKQNELEMLQQYIAGIVNQAVDTGYLERLCGRAQRLSSLETRTIVNLTTTPILSSLLQEMQAQRDLIYECFEADAQAFLLLSSPLSTAFTEPQMCEPDLDEFSRGAQLSFLEDSLVNLISPLQQECLVQQARQFSIALERLLLYNLEVTPEQLQQQLATSIPAIGQIKTSLAELNISPKEMFGEMLFRLTKAGQITVIFSGLCSFGNLYAADSVAADMEFQREVLEIFKAQPLQPQKLRFGLHQITQYKKLLAALDLADIQTYFSLASYFDQLLSPLFKPVVEYLKQVIIDQQRDNLLEFQDVPVTKQKLSELLGDAGLVWDYIAHHPQQNYIYQNLLSLVFSSNYSHSEVILGILGGHLHLPGKQYARLLISAGSRMKLQEYEILLNTLRASDLAEKQKRLDAKMVIFELLYTQAGLEKQLIQIYKLQKKTNLLFLRRLAYGALLGVQNSHLINLNVLLLLELLAGLVEAGMYDTTAAPQHVARLLSGISKNAQASQGTLRQVILVMLQRHEFAGLAAPVPFLAKYAFQLQRALQKKDLQYSADSMQLQRLFVCVLLQKLLEMEQADVPQVSLSAKTLEFADIQLQKMFGTTLPAYLQSTQRANLQQEHVGLLFSQLRNTLAEYAAAATLHSAHLEVLAGQLNALENVGADGSFWNILVEIMTTQATPEAVRKAFSNAARFSQEEPRMRAFNRALFLVDGHDDFFSLLQERQGLLAERFDPQSPILCPKELSRLRGVLPTGMKKSMSAHQLDTTLLSASWSLPEPTKPVVQEAQLEKEPTNKVLSQEVIAEPTAKQLPPKIEEPNPAKEEPSGASLEIRATVVDQVVEGQVTGFTTNELYQSQAQAIPVDTRAICIESSESEYDTVIAHAEIDHLAEQIAQTKEHSEPEGGLMVVKTDKTVPSVLKTYAPFLGTHAMPIDASQVVQATASDLNLCAGVVHRHFEPTEEQLIEILQQEMALIHEPQPPQASVPINIRVRSVAQLLASPLDYPAQSFAQECFDFQAAPLHFQQSPGAVCARCGRNSTQLGVSIEPESQENPETSEGSSEKKSASLYACAMTCDTVCSECSGRPTKISAVTDAGLKTVTLSPVGYEKFQRSLQMPIYLPLDVGKVPFVAIKYRQSALHSKKLLLQFRDILLGCPKLKQLLQRPHFLGEEAVLLEQNLSGVSVALLLQKAQLGHAQWLYGFMDEDSRRQQKHLETKQLTQSQATLACALQPIAQQVENQNIFGLRLLQSIKYLFIHAEKCKFCTQLLNVCEHCHGRLGLETPVHLGRRKTEFLRICAKCEGK